MSKQPFLWSRRTSHFETQYQRANGHIICGLWKICMRISIKLFTFFRVQYCSFKYLLMSQMFFFLLFCLFWFQERFLKYPLISCISGVGEYLKSFEWLLLPNNIIIYSCLPFLLITNDRQSK